MRDLVNKVRGATVKVGGHGATGWSGDMQTQSSPPSGLSHRAGHFCGPQSGTKTAYKRLLRWDNRLVSLSLVCVFDREA